MTMGGAFVYVSVKPGKEVALTINTGRMYYISHLFWLWTPMTAL